MISMCTQVHTPEVNVRSTTAANARNAPGARPYCNHQLLKKSTDQTKLNTTKIFMRIRSTVVLLATTKASPQLFVVCSTGMQGRPCAAAWSSVWLSDTDLLQVLLRSTNCSCSKKSLRSSNWSISSCWRNLRWLSRLTVSTSSSHPSCRIVHPTPRPMTSLATWRLPTHTTLTPTTSLRSDGSGSPITSQTGFGRGWYVGSQQINTLGRWGRLVGIVKGHCIGKDFHLVEKSIVIV